MSSAVLLSANQPDYPEGGQGVQRPVPLQGMDGFALLATRNMRGDVEVLSHRALCIEITVPALVVCIHDRCNHLVIILVFAFHFCIRFVGHTLL